MSSDHGTSSLNNRPTDASRRPDADRPAEGRREPPPTEQVDRFRQLMQQGRQDPRALLQKEEQRLGTLEASKAAQAAARQAEHDAGLHGLARQTSQDGADNTGMGANSLEPAEMLAMMQAQNALRDGNATPATAPPPAASGRHLAEMLERHVRQLAVDGAASGDGDGHVLLRMADATLPGTDLLLSKTGDGWLLRADVRSRGSYDAIREAAPQLAQRFAEQNLGRLEIDPHFHG